MSTLSDQPAVDAATGSTTGDLPVLYVCHGDDGGPGIHPCRRVHEALRAADVPYTSMVAAHGSPIPFLRRGSRDELEAATGTRKLPTMVLTDGTVLVHQKAILGWVAEQGRG